MIYTCCSCLRAADDGSLMACDEIKMYKTFVPEANENSMKICIHCKWAIRKLIKLTDQWQTAYAVLLEGGEMNTKSLFMRSIHKFTVTTEQHYLGPEEDDQSDGYDADEVPLIMLSNREFKKKKHKRDAIKTTDIKIELDIKEECTDDSGSKDQKRKSKYESQDGFTNRMVRETNEYTVIKLTKEQVLEEMLLKSTSDSYLRAAYKCEKCVKGFNFEDVLKTHAIKHSQENGSFQCDICSQYCPSAVSLRGHMKSHTTRYKCKICGSVRLSRQHLLEHHAIAHTSEAACYKCDTCQFVTNKRTVMQRHVKTHSSERHTCDQCGKIFKTVTSLRVHTIRHDKSRGFQCPQCDKTFIYPSVLHKHVVSVHERHDYYCVECDVKFKSPETLKHHFKKAKRHRDSSSYKYTCDQCPARFISSSSLQAHAHSAHGVGSSHACKMCPRSYSSRDTLRAHVWRTHANVQRTPTSCGVCGNTFSRASSLKSHMRIHTRGVSHVCVCGATFAHAHTLRAHRADKHVQKEELPNEARAENTSLEI